MPRKNTAPAALPPLMLGGSLWAIRADALPRVLELASSTAAAARGALPAPAAFLDLDDEGPSAAPAGAPGVAVIPLTGVLTPHGSVLSFLFGGGSRGVQGFRDQLAQAVANPDVKAIILDVDSPGGSTGLIAEAAADVRAARDIKPVIAVANTQAASGAYWIASQASELYVTPSGMVGSIGVYYAHEDWSRANDRMGIAVTYVHAGRFKTEGNPDEPLSPEAREAWQADADAIYSAFIADVATGRGATAENVLAGYGEGRVLLAANALEAGMVDGVDTLQGVLGRTLTAAASSAGASARRIARAEAPAPGPRAEVPAPGGPPAETTDQAEHVVPREDPDVPEPDVAPSAPAPEVPEPDLAPEAPAPEAPEPDVAPAPPADEPPGPDARARVAALLFPA